MIKPYNSSRWGGDAHGAATRYPARTQRRPRRYVDLWEANCKPDTPCFTLVVLLASAVSARHAATGATALCAFSSGAVIAIRRWHFNISLGTNPDTVTLTASVLGGSLVQVNLFGSTSAVCAGDYHRRHRQRSLRCTVASCRVINGAAERARGQVLGPTPEATTCPPQEPQPIDQQTRHCLKND
jgi:hypothetical protein